MRKLLPPAILFAAAVCAAQEGAGENVFLGVPEINFPVAPTVEGPQEGESQIPRAPNLKAAITPCFSIIGEDSEAIDAARYFALACEEIFNEAFLARLAFQQRIILQMAPEDKCPFDGDFSVSVSGANVTIAAKWHKDLPQDGFAKLVSGAMLRKLALAQGVEDAEVPFWMELAFSKILESRFAPNLIYYMARESSQREVSPLRNTLSLARGSADYAVAQADSFWAFRALSSLLKEDFSVFLKGALVGKSVDEQMGFADRITGGTWVPFDTVWVAAVRGEMLSRLGGAQAPEASRAEILRLGVIAAEGADGELVTLTGRQIWENRRSASAAAAIAARVTEAKIGVMFVNRIYLGSLLSLGVMYDCALEGDEDGFNSALAEFVERQRAALETEKRAKELLELPEEELAKLSPAQNTQ